MSTEVGEEDDLRNNVMSSAIADRDDLHLYSSEHGA